MVEGGGFEPPKLARQIYSLIPLATREPLPRDNPRVKNPGTLTQERHFMGIAVLVQSFHRDFLYDLNGADLASILAMKPIRQFWIQSAGLKPQLGR